MVVAPTAAQTFVFNTKFTALNFEQRGIKPVASIQ
jgi:hypothetical protein